MAWLNRSNKSSVGIDVGSKYLRAVQLQRFGGAWRVEAATAIPRQTPDSSVSQEEVSRFAVTLTRQGFAGRDVVLAAPEGVLLGGILKLPPRGSGAPLDQIATMETARMHRCEPQSFELAAWDLPTTGPGTDTTQVMVAACPHEVSDQLLDLFEAAGLNVVALDTSAWSITRACARLTTDTPNITAILDLGWKVGRLVVLYNGVIIYERTLPDVGIDRLSDALAKQTGQGVEMVDLLLMGNMPEQPNSQAPGIPDYSALLHTAVEAHVDVVIEEIKQSFSYASHRYPDVANQQLLVVGGGAGIAGMCPCIANHVGITTRTVKMSDLSACSHELTQTCNSSAFVKALGLAMHGLVPQTS